MSATAMAPAGRRRGQLRGQKLYEMTVQAETTGAVVAARLFGCRVRNHRGGRGTNPTIRCFSHSGLGRDRGGQGAACSGQDASFGGQGRPHGWSQSYISSAHLAAERKGQGR